MHWKTKGRLAGAVLLTALFTIANSGVTAGSAAAHLPQPATTLLSETKVLAHQHLDRFLKHVERNPRLRDTASVKVFHSDRLGYIWVHFIKQGDSLYVGHAKQYAPIVFSEDQIEDWSFVGADNRLYGNFTARAAQARLSSAESQHMQAVLSASPAPIGW